MEFLKSDENIYQIKDKIKILKEEINNFSYKLSELIDYNKNIKRKIIIDVNLHKISDLILSI